MPASGGMLFDFIAVGRPHANSAMQNVGFFGLYMQGGHFRFAAIAVWAGIGGLGMVGRPSESAASTKLKRF